MNMTAYFTGDKLTRTFTKQRGETTVDYVFTCRSSLFDASKAEASLLILNAYMKQVIQYGTLYKELGCSNCKEIFGLEFGQRKSEVINICRKANHLGKGREMHDIVQNYFIKNDVYTICTELPVFSNKYNRNGFIDLVRYDPVKDILWILDFKPNAHKERYQKVMSQLFWYRYMLAELLGLPDTMFKCAYFDDINFYELI